MEHYFIIDYAGYLFLIEGKNEQDARDEFKYLQPKRSIDIVTPAVKCEHGNYLPPAVADYVKYQPIEKKIICRSATCTADKVLFEHAKTVTI